MMHKTLAAISSVLSIITLLAGASYLVFGIWEILRTHFTDSTLIAAAIMFPVTLVLTPIYAIVALDDWRLLVVLVATVVLVLLLRFAKRNFERSA